MTLDKVQVVDVDDSCPHLPLVEGGTARAVIWPGTGARYRSMHLFELDPGGRTVEMRHPMEAVYYVIEGDAVAKDLRTGEQHRATMGGMIFVEPETPYVIRTDGNSTRLVGGPCPPDPSLYAGLTSVADARSVKLDELGWESIDAKLRKCVVDGERMTLTRYSFDPGGRFPHHVHDQEQLTYVLFGNITFLIDGVGHDLDAGSLVVIPASVPHSAEAGPKGAEVLSVVSPARTGAHGVEMLEEE